VGGGSGNAAGADFATVGGGTANLASNSFATVGGGSTNTASGGGSTVAGGSGNSGSGEGATVPGGIQASASQYGQMAYASGSFDGTPGQAQGSLFVLRNVTTDSATSTDLFLDGVSQRITVAPGQTMVFDVLIVARGPSGSSSLSYGYHARGVIENDPLFGVNFIGGTPNTTLLGQDPLTGIPFPTVTFQTTTSGLSIAVTGLVGVTLRWVATVRTAEVAF
jgi:hypothetical protein